MLQNSVPAKSTEIDFPFRPVFAEKYLSKEAPELESKSVSNISRDAQRLNQRVKIKKTLAAYAFLLPIVIFAIMFVYYPFVKTIINSHGENISVTSRDGTTEFTFTLPHVN